MKRSRVTLKPRARQRTKFSQKQIAIVASSVVACLSICLVVFFNTTSNTEVKAETSIGSSGTGSAENHRLSAAELTGFDILPQDQTVSFFWNAATETENDFFTVERSSDGKEFSAVAKVKGGEKSKMSRYSAADDSPISGVTYYRLKQTDKNGKVIYSSAKAIKNDNKEDSKLSLNIDEVYPNRFENHFVLQYSAKNNAAITFKIMSSSGQVLYIENLKSTLGDNEYIFKEGDKLRSGAYIATLSCGNEQVSTKIVKD